MWLGPPGYVTLPRRFYSYRKKKKKRGFKFSPLLVQKALFFFIHLFFFFCRVIFFPPSLVVNILFCIVTYPSFRDFFFLALCNVCTGILQRFSFVLSRFCLSSGVVLVCNADNALMASFCRASTPTALAFKKSRKPPHFCVQARPRNSWAQILNSSRNRRVSPLLSFVNRRSRTTAHLV